MDFTLIPNSWMPLEGPIAQRTAKLIDWSLRNLQNQKEKQTLALSFEDK